ncbi:MAG: DUF4012 domain-containing protein [Patescibacteria group bacterium]
MSQYKNKEIQPTRKHRVNPSFYGVPSDNVLNLKELQSAKETVKQEKEDKLSRKERRLLKKQEKLKKKQELRKELKTQKKSKPAKVKKTKEKLNKPKQFKPEFSWGSLTKSLASFVIFGLVIVLPFASSAYYQQLDDIKATIMDMSKQAISNLKTGGEKIVAMDFQGADQDFSQSVENFQEAKTQLDDVNSVMSSLIKIIPVKGDEFESAENILIAGENLAGAASDLAKAFDLFNDLELGSISSDTDFSITSTLVVLHSALRPTVAKIELANKAMENVSPSVAPGEYQEQILLLQEQLPVLSKNLSKILSLTETLLSVLGHESPKRYLVLFQNNHEIRPTGGFIGSIALVDIDQGKVMKLEVPKGGTYDVSGNLNVDLIAPTPLHLVNSRWELQDANWWIDFPVSAEKIEWFYEKSGGPSVDGIITLTPSVIEQMLAITGPIDMTEDYDTIIDKDNFYDIVQNEAERKYDETTESKKIIGDLTPILLDQIFSLENADLGQVILMLYGALQEKDILFYFNDKYLEQEIKDLGWGGELKQTPKDFLSVVNTNIAGGKTDGQIEEIIEHSAQINSDGSIINTVQVTRTHKGQTDDEFANVKNIDYVRFYVPEGSEFISAEGFNQPDQDLFFDVEEEYEVDEDLKAISGNVIIEDTTRTRINNELGKTVFGNWIQVSPGESQTVSISYKLPFILKTEKIFNKFDSYSILFQKQPGSLDPLVISKLQVPDNFEQVWQYPTDFTKDYSTTLNVDRFYGVVLKHK